MKSTLSEKGQVTIPKTIREQLGLRTGHVIDFEAKAGQLIGRKQSGGDPLVDVIGIARGRIPDVDTYLDTVRGPRPRPRRRSRR